MQIFVSGILIGLPCALFYIRLINSPFLDSLLFRWLKKDTETTERERLAVCSITVFSRQVGKNQSVECWCCWMFVCLSSYRKRLQSPVTGSFIILDNFRPPKNWALQSEPLSVILPRSWMLSKLNIGSEHSYLWSSRWSKFSCCTDNFVISHSYNENTSNINFQCQLICWYFFFLPFVL